VSDTPRIVASDGKWRIVRTEQGERVTNILEKHDGCDALGCERWKSLNIGEADTITRQLRDWIIAHALACPCMGGKNADSA
jgi:hypothetical protein